MLLPVNCMHFFASPSFMMYNTFGKINENLPVIDLILKYVIYILKKKTE